MKKGAILLPGFAILFTLMLTSALFVMNSHNEERKVKYVEKVGYPALALFKVYDEGERQRLYVEQSIKYSGLIAELNILRVRIF